jgi:hypothetical protein
MSPHPLSQPSPPRALSITHNSWASVLKGSQRGCEVMGPEETAPQFLHRLPVHWQPRNSPDVLI